MKYGLHEDPKSNFYVLLVQEIWFITFSIELA